MKVLKWFRYGFLSLGFIFLVLFLLFIPGWLPLPFDINVFYQIFVASALSFIVYAIVRIIELCKSENKFEPLVLYYIGFIMSCIVYSNLVNHSPTYYFFEQPFSGNLTPIAKEIIVWLYFILTTFFLFIGVIWEGIKVVKQFRNDRQKLISLSNGIITIGTAIFLVGFIWFQFFALDYTSYVFYLGNILGIVKIFSIFLLISFPILLIGLIVRIIYLLKNVTERNIIKEE